MEQTTQTETAKKTVLKSELQSGINKALTDLMATVSFFRGWDGSSIDQSKRQQLDEKLNAILVDLKPLSADVVFDEEEAPSFGDHSNGAKVAGDRNPAAERPVTADNGELAATAKSEEAAKAGISDPLANTGTTVTDATKSNIASNTGENKDAAVGKEAAKDADASKGADAAKSTGTSDGTKAQKNSAAKNEEKIK